MKSYIPVFKGLKMSHMTVQKLTKHNLFFLNFSWMHTEEQIVLTAKKNVLLQDYIGKAY